MGYPTVQSIMNRFYFPDNRLWFSSSIPHTSAKHSFILLLLYQNTYKPAHDKTYNKTCAIRGDSDQPA